MTAEKLDKIFDDGEEEFLPYLNPAKAVRPGHLAQRVNVDFPSWMISSLDFEADRLGVPGRAPAIPHQSLDRRTTSPGTAAQSGNPGPSKTMIDTIVQEIREARA